MPRNHQAKETINQIIRNLGYQNKTEFTSAELRAIESQLNDIAIYKSELEGFIGHITSDDKLESLNGLSEEDRHHAIARNLFRYLFRGASLCIDKSDSLFKSPLFTKEVFDSILQKRNPAIFKALRDEFQVILNNICDNLNKSAGSEQYRYEKLLDIILSIYPFIDPDINKTVNIPINTAGKWELQAHKFDRFNISPHTGPLSWVLEPEDYIYAYGLTPVAPHPSTRPILIFMGTTFPAGQGAELADLYNFYPGHSVGEGHDLTEVEAWLQKQSNVRVVGHSKGATMSMVAAAKYPQFITQADCFNPAPLTAKTLDRLSPDWEKLDKQPVINAYLQPGDPVSYIGRGFLKDINIIHIIPESDQDIFYENHAHYFLGRKNTITVKGNVDQFNQSTGRKFIDRVKSVVDYIKFPLQYIGYFLRLSVRKFENFYKDNLALCRFIIGAAAFVLLLSLLGAGIFFPPVAAILGIIGATAYTQITATLLTLVAIAATPFLLEKIALLTKNLINAALSIVHVGMIIVAGILASIGAGFSLIGEHDTPKASNSTHQYVRSIMHEESSTPPQKVEEESLIATEQHNQPKIPKDEVVKMMHSKFFMPLASISTQEDDITSSFTLEI